MAESEQGKPFDHKEACHKWRKDIERIKEDLRNLPFTGDEDEYSANILLAYRHLEDAKMRIGKAIQALERQRVLLQKMKRVTL